MRKGALGIWAACLLLAACASREALTVLAKVNGEPISTRALDLERSLAGPRAGDDKELLESLIDQALILQEGRRLGVTLSSDALEAAEEQARGGTEDAELAASLAERGVSLAQWRSRLASAALANEVVRQAIRDKVEIGRQEIQDYYWEHLTAFRHSEHRVLRQVFCKDRDRIEAAQWDLERRHPFAEVAKRWGQGPEAAQGGWLGPFGRTQLPKVLATAAEKLKPGTYSPILRSHWGWHLLYLEAVQKEQDESLGQASAQARARLLRDKEQGLYQYWLGHLREQATIERLGAPLAPKATPKAGS